MKSGTTQPGMVKMPQTETLRFRISPVRPPEIFPKPVLRLVAAPVFTQPRLVDELATKKMSSNVTWMPPLGQLVRSSTPLVPVVVWAEAAGRQLRKTTAATAANNNRNLFMYFPP